jgi:hypothetical protein
MQQLQMRGNVIIVKMGNAFQEFAPDVQAAHFMHVAEDARHVAAFRRLAIL